MYNPYDYDTLVEEEENPFLRPAPLPVPPVKPVPAAPLPELALPLTGLEEVPEVPEEEPLDPIKSLPKGFTIDQPEAPSTAPEESALASLPEGFTIDRPEAPKLEPDTEPAPEVKQSDWLDGINEVLRGASSEGVLMGMEGLYGMVEQRTKGTFLESLFKPAGEQRKAMTEMRERVRQGLPVDRDFAESTAGQVLEGVGQLTNIPLYAVPVVGTALGAGLSFGQLYQEAKEDYIQTQKAKGLPIDDAVADRAALEYMAGAGALEIAADKLILGKFLKAARKTGLSVGDVLKTTGSMAASGAISEGGQEAVLNTVANTLEGYDPERKFDENVYQSALVGGLIGGVGGVTAEAGGYLAGRAAAPPVQAPAPVTPPAAVPVTSVVPPGAPPAAVPPAVTPPAPVSPAQAQALQQAAVQAGQLPTSAGIPITPQETQANLLKQAAVQAPTLIADEGQRRAALLGQAAEAATVSGQATQRAEQARLLRQASLQVPGLETQSGVALPPGITPAEAMAAPPAPDPIAERLASVNRQLLRATSSRAATVLEKERRVLENKLESVQNVAVAKEASVKAVAAGAPKTAQALVQSTTEVLTARDQVVRDAVDMAPEDIFAEEAVSPAGPRRGEPGFVSPPGGGQVIGERPAVPGVAAPPTSVTVPSGAAAPPAAAPAVYQPGQEVEGPGALPGMVTGVQPNGAVMVDWGRGPEATSPDVLKPAVQEVVLRPGIKGQEAVIQRPSAQIRQALTGAKVNVEVFSTNGEKRLQSQDAATALMELKRDKTGFKLLSDCLNLK